MNKCLNSASSGVWNLPSAVNVQIISLQYNKCHIRKYSKCDNNSYTVICRKTDRTTETSKKGQTPKLVASTL